MTPSELQRLIDMLNRLALDMEIVGRPLAERRTLIETARVVERERDRRTAVA